jgi:hypothetical protein
MSPSTNSPRQRSPSTNSPRQRSPGSWSPRTRQAARTIKRIVTKKYTRRKYRNFTINSYRAIRRGELPTHTSAIKRRMHMFPIRVNVPLYRGLRPQWAQKLLNNGQLLNTSFSSFSKNKSVTRNFASYSGKIIVLPPGKYPAINRERFTGSTYEHEITLAPGVFTMNGYTNKGNIRVRYKPLNNGSRKTS